MLLHFLVHYIAQKKYQTYREEMNLRERIEYRAYITSPIHALLCVFLSVTAMFYICGEDKTVFNDA